MTIATTASLPVDTLDRFLRPKAVAEGAASGWGESDTVWVPDADEGFVLARVMKEEAGKAVLDLNGAIIDIPAGKMVERSNPSRDDRAEDMAGMTELNEATILHNLRRRYQSNLIYTYSGLFLVAVNPYRDHPIYSEAVMDWYRGVGSRSDRPPHIYATADCAYRMMVETRRNQSILITGESGAGKTENTKRVIQYLAGAAASSSSSTCSLEARILAANPILEAFGNAQTVRNNNSSRFGKFIKIEFGAGGQIVGGHVERYLLEKSRVTCRSEKERSFHVFYQLLRGASPEMKARLGLEGAVNSYKWTRGSNTNVEGVDDVAGFKDLLASMDTLGFSEEEKEGFLKAVAIILHLGNIDLLEDAQGQAQFKDSSQIDKLCSLIGVDSGAFSAALLNPVIRAGSEIVHQERDISQVTLSLESLGKTLYERLFTRLVERINQAIRGEVGAKATAWIGVLDIAGFEIFDRNSFEQLCVNYTNEKLQQFFNHHMFTAEQAEYAKERVDWQPVDFGLDLQPTIDLIERSHPVGVLACLDEDCVLPKATDASFYDKICGIWKGKSEKFEATRFGDAFAIHHYAGRVEYSTEGWLEKNKDPLNEGVLNVISSTCEPQLAKIFTEDMDSSASRIVKRGQFRTVSQRYRESLQLLMSQLAATQPHFVRCIIPNEAKKPGQIDAQLVLSQLRCNGVLEGIRICRMGYPNRVPYGDFCRLYELLASKPLDGDHKMAAKELLQHLGIDHEAYRLGSTKVFFRAGELLKLDEKRDKKLSSVLSSFQAQCRGALARQAKGRLVRQAAARELIQKSARKALSLQQWPWWRLYMRVKPLLNVTRSENRIDELEMELERVTEERQAQAAQLRSELESERDKLMALETARRDAERHLQELSIQLNQTEERKMELTERVAHLEREIEALKTEMALKEKLEKEKSSFLQEEFALKDNEHLIQISQLKQQISTLTASLDAADIEKLKLERSESSQRSRTTELEQQIEELKEGKKDLESRCRQAEDQCRQLTEKLESDEVGAEKIARLQASLEAQLSAERSRHSEEMAQRAEELDAARKRLQREILQLTAELEAERKQTSAHRETIRQYESGNDSLSNKLEAELRNQEAWRREKERLEQRIKDLSKLHQEAAEREDGLQATLWSSHEATRDLKSRLAAMEDEALSRDRLVRQLELRLERSTETLTALTVDLEEKEKRREDFESKLADLTLKLADEQDETFALKERIRTAEHVGKITQHQAIEAMRHLQESREECKRLETLVKDLQARLIETSSLDTSEDFGSLRLGSVTLSSLATLKAKLQQDADDRLSLLTESRRQERLIQDLTTSLSTSDRTRIALEESLSMHEIRLRKATTNLDALEQQLAETEMAKRRAEREAETEREERERVVRELERFKGRLAVKSE